MTDLKQAAQQALEALEKAEEVIEDEYGGTSSFDRLSCAPAITALRAALAEPEQEPDGISWLKRDSGYFTAPTPRKPLSEEEIVRLMVGEDRVQLLYAKPDDPYFSEFAQGAIRELVESGRAIERAHGIGEQHE